MAAFKELVDRDCGGANPLMKLTSHLTQDKAYKQDGLRRSANRLPYGLNVPFEAGAEEELVNEFLAEQHHFQNAPTTFQMGALLQEMQQIEGAREQLIQGPSVIDLAENWADEYLEPTNSQPLSMAAAQPLGTQWASEFLESGFSDTKNALWAREFLEGNEHESQSHDFVKELDLSAADWSEEFQKAESSDGKSLADQWKEEFSRDSNLDDQLWNFLKDGTDFRFDEANSWASEFENAEYKFEEENPLSDHPDPFDEGLKRLKMGDITNAVLLFEAAAQKDPTDAVRWQYLGSTQSANEQDRFAIPALKKCMALSPDNLVALMALAVSYLNESSKVLAYDTLLQWLRKNPRYSHLVPPDMKIEADGWGYVSNEDSVRDLFIQAVQSETKDVDADIQTGLGILFNLNGEFDKAADCFNAALQVQPEDPMLWNKLGASLANGKRCEEAVNAYHQALNLSPGYVRTRYNLGIACMNLGAYKEAIEHFLIALNLQKNNRGLKDEKSAMSTTIWLSLQMAISYHGLENLGVDINQRDLDQLNKIFGIVT